MTRAGILALGAFLCGSWTLPFPILGQGFRAELEVVGSPSLQGMTFGGAGSYERLRGTVHGEVDPSDPRNLGITLLEFAPLNDAGQVEYTAEVELLRPTDMARWNGSLVVVIPRSGVPEEPDPALLARGFVVVSIGWQGTVPVADGGLSAHLPVARRADGSSVVGSSREEFVFDDLETRSEARLTYPPASLDPSSATLSVRRFQLSDRSTPDDLRWAFIGDGGGILVERPGGWDAGAIFEFEYLARDPVILGLGFAATRDIVAFLRHDPEDRDGRPNPLVGGPGSPGTRAVTVLGLGEGQGARFLRDFVYLGFNEDTQGRPVFDGIHPHGAGAGRTFTNVPFGQPDRNPRQHEDLLYPVYTFPFTYGVMEDPVGGGTDGILQSCTRTNTCPLVIHSDGEGEYWQARASLVVTNPRGAPIELPDGVRVYAIAGAAPVAEGKPSGEVCQHATNPFDGHPIRRALTVALDRWVREGTLPPPSRFPSVAERQLLLPGATAFANIDGVEYTGIHAPLFHTEAGTESPVPGEPYTVLVPRVDGDANMLDGIRHPLHRIAEGTYTGWNVRGPGYASGALCGGWGAYFPFAETRDDREESFDRRQSFRERYPDPAAYLEALEWTARELMEAGFLLPEDAEEILEAAPGRFR